MTDVLEQEIESAKYRAPRIRAVSDLKPWVDNPRGASQESLATLAESIKKYGLEDGATCAIQPVIVNQHPDYFDCIVGGEQRWRATQLAGIERVWTRDVWLDKEQMLELTLRLNVSAGEWDWDKLAEISSGQQLTLLGFKDLEFPSVAAVPELKLQGGTGRTVSEAEKGLRGAPPAAATQESVNRQYLVFLLAKEHEEMIGLIARLKVAYNVTSPAQVILRALRTEAAKVTDQEKSVAAAAEVVS